MKSKKLKKWTGFLVIFFLFFGLLSYPAVTASAEESIVKESSEENGTASDETESTEQTGKGSLEGVSMTWHIPHSIKIGEQYQNILTVTIGEDFPMAEDEQAVVLILENGDQYHVGRLFGKYGFWAHSGDTDDFDINTSTVVAHSRNALSAFHPGEVTLQPKIGIINKNIVGKDRQVEIGEPYMVTIEEPVIVDNAPEEVAAGDSLEFITELTNTALTNSDHTDLNNYYNLDGLQFYVPELNLAGNPSDYDVHKQIDAAHRAAYKPTVEVIEGAEIVEQSSQDYSNTLKSSEVLTFKGAGTVKLKVKYNQMITCPCLLDSDSLEPDPELYSPEKIVAIQVREKENSGKVNDKTGKDVTADTDGLDLDSIYKMYPADPDEDKPEIVLSEIETAQADSEKLIEKANIDGYSIVGLHEILMSLCSNGKKIGDITESFGNLRLSFQVDVNYKGWKAVVYQLHNSNEIIVHDGLEVDAEGKVTITVNKLSAFAIALGGKTDFTKPGSSDKKEPSMTPAAHPSAKQDTISNPENTAQGVSEIKNAVGSQAVAAVPKADAVENRSVQTGDDMELAVWIALCIVAGMMGIFTCYLKKVKSYKF